MALWLKHNLSIFFDFEKFGNLNWLAILLFVYFVATVKKRKRWEMTIAFVFILSCLFLSFKGQNNFRYIFTLYPFMLGAIFLIAWEFITKTNHQIQIGILIICGIAIFFNFYHFRETYKFYWRYKVTLADDYFPHEILKFINNTEDLKADSKFLVCSQRYLFYYYSNKKGIYHRDPKMRIFYRQKNKELALEVLKNQLKIKYILLHWYFEPSWILKNIITNVCDLIYQDKELSLYKIREKDLVLEKDLDKEGIEKIFVNNSLLRNGSFENWTNGPFKNPDFFEGSGEISGQNVFREEKEVKVGKYSAKITGDNFNFFQNLPNFEDYRGEKITCFAWLKTNVPNKYRIQIYDGVDFSFSFRHSGKGRWELLQVNHTINPQAKFLKIRVIQATKTGKVDDVVYVDGVLLLEGYLNTYALYSKHIKKRE